MKKETPFPESRIITSKLLIETIKESCDNNVRFCFILGSGASVSSGIKTGRQLENIWMKCLLGEEEDGFALKRDKEQTRELAKKLYKEKLLKHDFEQILKDWEDGKELSSDYYFDLYKLRFYPDSHNGDCYLEQIMEGKEPSFGYYILSFFMDKYKQNNLVITTNFDSLMEDALYLLSTTRPLVAGHESLARFISSDVHRPIVAKVHRSLFYEPFNSPQTTNSLNAGWSEALDYAFKTYVPIVIGYGGGDGSLMSFLEKQSTIMRHGVYWCYVGDNLPDERIQKFVKQKKGFFVRIDGFDELMLEMGDTLFGNEVKPESLEKLWLDQTNGRVNRYVEQLEAIKKKKSEAVKTIVQRMETEEKEEEQKRGAEKKLTYWDYVRRATRATDEGDYKTAIREWTNAIKKRPDAPTAYNNRGYIHDLMDNLEAAMEDVNKTIELDPGSFVAYHNRGLINRKWKNYEEAERDYKKAIELNSNYKNAYAALGGLYEILGRYDEAMENLNRALELDPDYDLAYNNRGHLYEVMGDYDKAKADLNKAIEINPDKANSYKHLGDIYHTQGYNEEAVLMLTEAIKRNTKYKDAYLSRAQVYREMGQVKKAEEDEKKAATY